MDSDELLRRLGRLEPENPPPASDCLPDDVLEAYQSGRLEEGERLEVERHLSSCGLCVDALLCLGRPPETMSPGTVERVLAATAPARARRSRGLPGWIAGAVAASAAVLLYLAAPGARSPMAVPPYGLELDGEVQTSRGASEPQPATLHRYAPESDIVLRAEPGQGHPAALPMAAAYLLHPDSRWLRFEPPPRLETDPASGTLELRVRAGDLLGSRYGTHRVRLLLLPPGVQPPGLLADDGTPPEGGVVLEATLEYVPGI